MLRGPVHWLGKRLPARGRFPALRCADSIRRRSLGGASGLRALLLYRSRAGRSAISLVLERPRALRQAALRRQLRRIRQRGVRALRAVPLSGGRASIYARARAMRARGRPDAARDRTRSRSAVAVVIAQPHPLRTTRALRNRAPACAGSCARCGSRSEAGRRPDASARSVAGSQRHSPCSSRSSTATSAAAASSPYSADLALRLPDLGPGYVVALDHGCVPLRPRGVAASSEGCQVSYKRVWTPTGMAPGPSFVTSVAFVFQSPEAAHAALARPRALAARVLGVRRDVIAIAGPTPALGDEAVLLRFDDRDTDVLWRSRIDRRAAWPQAARTAATRATSRPCGLPRRSRRMSRCRRRSRRAITTTSRCRSTTRASRCRCYWLGRRLAAHGSLPPLRFVGSELSRGQDARAGARAELRYEGHARLGRRRPDAAEPLAAALRSARSSPPARATRARGSRASRP